MIPHDQGRTLLVVNATLDPAIPKAIAQGRSPRKDYLELQRALDADVLDLGALDRQMWTRLVRRLAGSTVAQGLLAARRARHYQVVFADREATGFIIAALSRVRRVRPRLVMIGHLLSSPKKRRIFSALGLRRTTDRVIVHASAQARVADEALCLKREQISLLPYQTDERFWRPQSAPVRRQICSAGLEYRDYTTLLAAVQGLDIEMVIAAASHWSKHHGLAAAGPLPANVRVASFDYHALRTLYAESLFVVVPLQDVENQAGITTILEAMAMGKAVVVSHTRGQLDVIRDRRRVDRHAPERATQPAWPRLLGASDETAEGYNGIYVQPGDPDDLRRAIAFLVDHPEQARRMGENGRRVIEEVMGLDQFIARVASLIREEHRLYGEPSIGTIAPAT